MYSPGGAEISKWPALSVIASTTGPLVGANATLALGITAPVVSVTVPVIMEGSGCACAKHETAIASAASHLQRVKARWMVDRMIANLDDSIIDLPSHCNAADGGRSMNGMELC